MKTSSQKCIHSRAGLMLLGIGLSVVAGAVCAQAATPAAEDSAAELAKKLANPIANLKNEQWTVLIQMLAQQLVKFGERPVSFALGYRNYVAKPDGGPDWGLFFTMTLLYPK